MKAVLIILIFCTMMFSCKMKSGEGISDSDTTVVADSVIKSTSFVEKPGNRWIIPLTAAWKDPEHFVLVLPDSLAAFEFYEKATYTKYEQTIADTAQGIFSKTAPAPLSCGERLFYEVQLDRGKRTHGWATDEHLLFIDKKELGEYVMGERRLQFGTMKSRIVRHMPSKQEEECSVLHTLFFYSDNYLYLIDASKEEEDLRWQQETHLTIVNQVAGISITGKQQGADFVIGWGEPNVAINLVVTWDNDHLKIVSRQVDQLDSDVGDLVPEEIKGSVSKTETGTFQYAGAGDCFHLEFSCGDFGNAYSNKLKGDELALWNELSIEDANGEIIANPKYVYKNFEITYYYGKGEICGEAGASEASDKVQVITSFKMIN